MFFWIVESLSSADGSFHLHAWRGSFDDIIALLLRSRMVDG